MADVDLREQVRARYAEAAAAVAAADRRTALEEVDAAECCASEPSSVSCCAPAEEAGPTFGANLYSETERSELPVGAVAASLGCGNPILVADLYEGEKVLDLGSGGGIDVLLSARRVGDSGFAYGLDMTDEMLALANRNAAQAGVENVEFIKGVIEDIPLPDQAVDVVLSNCVVNLSTDKTAVFGEMYRVLVPGGRIGVSDVVADDHLTEEDRARRGSHVGCIAGALSRSEYLEGLRAAGFEGAEVVYTHDVADGMHGAIIRATKPRA